MARSLLPQAIQSGSICPGTTHRPCCSMKSFRGSSWEVLSQSSHRPGRRRMLSGKTLRARWPSLCPIVRAAQSPDLMRVTPRACPVPLTKSSSGRCCRWIGYKRRARPRIAATSIIFRLWIRHIHSRNYMTAAPLLGYTLLWNENSIRRDVRTIASGSFGASSWYTRR